MAAWLSFAKGQFRIIIRLGIYDSNCRHVENAPGCHRILKDMGGFPEAQQHGSHGHATGKHAKQL